ncbi:MAG: YicC family protein [Luteitalea sp.]|nr:YicC family protein [Luteitalea sp.]
MIKSMTGFASVTKEDEIATVVVTLRSVNHRHLDVQMRIPSSLQGVEAALRGVLQRSVVRGRVDVTIAAQTRAGRPPVVEVNESLVDALTTTMARLRARSLIDGMLTPGDLLRLPQAVTFRDVPNEQDEQRMAALVRAALGEATVALDAMRGQEGAYLRAELDSRRASLADAVDRIEAAAQAGANGLEARLKTKLEELRVDAEPQLLAQEIVRLVARSDISEELVRLRAHVQHWQALSDGPEACGRKLDFLLQEMHREVNTIGSKAEGPEVSELIVHVKAELEKMREQVQNVE